MSLWSDPKSKARAAVHFKTCKYLAAEKYDEAVEITKCL
jgi:hypothetical protein